LRGSAGTQRIESTPWAASCASCRARRASPGDDLQLTIDADLQAYVEARMEGESAAAVVIDCATGDLLAVGNAPTFDPNLFVRGISVPDWRRLNEDIYRPLSAKAVQGRLPAGLDLQDGDGPRRARIGRGLARGHGLLPGRHVVSGIRFHCWKRGGHGNVDFHQSLVVSCDCYYYEVGQRAGIEAISDMARKLGIGVRHDVPMSAVAEGIAPNRRMEAAHARRRVARGRHRQRVHRPGLRARHAAPARGDGGAAGHGTRGPAAARQVDQRRRAAFGRGRALGPTRTCCGGCAPRCTTW
jgi:penicillin-binding protein 2